MVPYISTKPGSSSWLCGKACSGCKLYFSRINFKPFFALVLFVIAGILIVGCGKVITTPAIPNLTNLVSILITPNSHSLMAGATHQFAATGQFSDGTTATISPTWEVVGEVGTIDATGQFFANIVGNGTIEARIGGVVGRATVEVTPRVISGYVYDSALSNLYSSSRTPIQGASIYLGSQIATTDNNGYFSFSGVPTGELVLAAIKTSYYPVVIATNKNEIKLYLSWITTYPLPVGSSTMRGLVSGMPSGHSPGSPTVCGLDNNRTTAGNYDLGTQRYTVVNAPDSGDAYIGMSCSTLESGKYTAYMTYNRTTMTPGTTEVDLTFGNNTLNCNVTVPTGFQTKLAMAMIYKGARKIPLSSAYKDLSGETSISLNRLPDLLAGDSYTVEMRVMQIGNTQESWVRYVYNASGTINFDFSSITNINYIAPTPVEGGNISVSPTIAWEPGPWSNMKYYMYIFDDTLGQRVFEGYTGNNSITIPEIFKFYSGRSYHCYVMAMAFPAFEVEDLATLFSSYWDQYYTMRPRRFIGGY